MLVLRYPHFLPLTPAKAGVQSAKAVWLGGNQENWFPNQVWDERGF